MQHKCQVLPFIEAQYGTNSRNIIYIYTPQNESQLNSQQNIKTTLHTTQNIIQQHNHNAGWT